MIGKTQTHPFFSAFFRSLSTFFFKFDFSFSKSLFRLSCSRKWFFCNLSFSCCAKQLIHKQTFSTQKDVEQRQFGDLWITSHHPDKRNLCSLHVSFSDTKFPSVHWWNRFTKVVLHLSGLTDPTSHFCNGTHGFSELVLPRMALLMDQSRSVLGLSRPKHGNLENCGGKNVRAHLWAFHLNRP